jgi:predicted RNA-binding Zn-ribbon protein involved in translation (DUF1610 family)
MTELAVTPILTEAERLANAIRTRRLRKCIAEGVHVSPLPEAGEDACPRCGL